VKERKSGEIEAEIVGSFEKWRLKREDGWGNVG
jgi:hypothetical protein